MVKTSFRLPHGCGGISRISRVWGRHSPTRFPQGQNERKANFGTSVESCSKKLPDCRSLPTATFSGNRNQLFFTHRALGWLRFARCMKKSAAFSGFIP